MILQELNSLYERLASAPEESNIPQYGFCRQGVHFCLTLDEQGELVGDPIDLREGKTPRRMEVPLAVKKSVNIASNFLWENTGYVLGADAKGKPERSAQTFAAFKERLHEIGGDVDDPGMRAVLKFVETWSPEQAESLPLWEEMQGLNVVFRLDGRREFVHESAAVREAWLAFFLAQASDNTGDCLVTGETAPISRLHASIKGVMGAQSAGAALVSFNKESFSSYGKDQNFNAPVSERAAFGYTTALNHLLRRDSGQKVQIGDAATVFWTARPCDAPQALAQLLHAGLVSFEDDGEEDAEAPAQYAGRLKELRAFFQAVQTGRPPHPLEDGDTPFFILGLAPNAARLSVRFWHVSTVEDVSRAVGAHFRDLALVKNYDREPDCPSVWQLLKETAALGKTENIAPQLGGQLMRAVLTGGRYPQALLNMLMCRIRADKNVNYLRAAMLKAWLVRNRKKEISVFLDKNNTNPPYLLGRLFAMYERAQELAIPGANATMKDRFYGAAAATPARVFVTLEKNSANHLAKLRKDESNKNTAGWLQHEIGDIIAGLSDFPTTLDVEEQAVFILGYYHQRKDFFTSKEEREKQQELSAAEE